MGLTQCRRLDSQVVFPVDIQNEASIHSRTNDLCRFKELEPPRTTCNLLAPSGFWESGMISTVSCIRCFGVSFGVKLEVSSGFHTRWM